MRTSPSPTNSRLMSYQSTLALLALLCLTGVSASACNGGRSAKSGTEQTVADTLPNASVVVMDKALFLKEVYDYTSQTEWKYQGKLPAIIDLYADWCGPCRRVAPVMQELAKEYAGRIVIYKVNVDQEQELATLFQASSIPLFVFIPMKGLPQLLQGATTKENYKRAIDEFLLKQSPTD